MTSWPKAAGRLNFDKSAYIYVHFFLFPSRLPPPTILDILLVIIIMAEKTQPGDTSQISRKRARTLTNASSESTSDLLHTEPIRISQRIRTNSSKVLEKENATQDSLPEVSFERRRVNPESLALRLGPELVRDLDSLIPPGSRDMPSFAARKELQERHKVDRRHIYDYYHSKGLRVVKEDKHGNPIRQVEQPTLTSEVYQVS